MPLQPTSEPSPMARPEAHIGSHTVCLLSIVAALQKADDFLGQNRVWSPGGSGAETQRRFLEFYEPSKDIIPDLNCIAAIADYDIQVINAWLKERGFNIELECDPGPGGFATASVLDILVNWKAPGTVSQVAWGTSSYPAFTLKQGFQLLRTPYVEPVVYIQTQEGYNIFLTMADHNPGPGFALLDTILPIRNVNTSEPIRGYDGVTIPMVSLNEKIDLSWLRGLNTMGEDGVIAFISEAVGRNKYRMNQFGARAQSGVALGVSRGISMSRYYVIDRPFFLWIDTPDGMEDEIPPLFGAYLGPDVWADPGDLSVA